MPRHRPLVLAAAVAVFCAAAFMQSAIPLRTVSAPVGTDSGLLATITSIRPLADGRVLVNDQGHLRALVFDTTLAHYTVVMDTAQGRKDKYAAKAMTMFPFSADSAAFLDLDAGAFVIVSPAGTVARVMAMPRQSDLIPLVVTQSGGFDAKGRLIFRTGRSRPAGQTMPAIASQDSGTLKIEFTRDSGAVIRVDPDTKAVDTLGLVALTRAKVPSMSIGRGVSFGPSATNPFPDPDDWVFFSDGTIAIARGHDYHVDWVSPNLTTTSSPKLPFDWKRIPDEDKQQKSDSLRKVAEARAAARAAAPPPPPGGRGSGFAATVWPPVWFTPGELPDYYPVIRVATTRADPEGNVWLLPTTSLLAGQGLVYDVVNRKGELFERVRLPEGRNLIAVGRGGVVYMTYTPKGGLLRLERARVIR